MMNKTLDNESRESPVWPSIIYGEGTDPAIVVNPQSIAQTMQELGISDESIVSSTVYIDPESRFLTFGTHYPNRIGRLRFHSIPEMREAKGDIVRLSTVMKGEPRTADEMNQTLVHELEHVAQQVRQDKNLTEGHVAIWGLAMVGAIVGNRLFKRKASKVMGTAIGAGLGHSLGYMIAPHERQARARARQTKTASISYRTSS